MAPKGYDDTSNNSNHDGPRRPLSSKGGSSRTGSLDQERAGPDYGYDYEDERGLFDEVDVDGSDDDDDPAKGGRGGRKAKNDDDDTSQHSDTSSRSGAGAQRQPHALDGEGSRRNLSESAQLRAAKLDSARRVDKERALQPYHVKNRKCIIKSSLCVLVLILVGISAGLAVYFVGQQDGGDSSVEAAGAAGQGNSTTTPPFDNTGIDPTPYNENDSNLTPEEKALKKKRKHRSDIASKLVLHGLSSSESLVSPGTPQNASLEWMAHHDLELNLSPHKPSEWTHFMQRYVVVVLYFSLVPEAIEMLVYSSAHSGTGHLDANLDTGMISKTNATSANSTDVTSILSDFVFIPPITGTGLDTWLSQSVSESSSGAHECEWDYITCEPASIALVLPALNSTGINNITSQEANNTNIIDDGVYSNGDGTVDNAPQRQRTLLRGGDLNQNDQSIHRQGHNLRQLQSFVEVAIDPEEADVIVSAISLGEDIWLAEKFFQVNDTETNIQIHMFGRNATMPSELGFLSNLKALSLSHLHWDGTLPATLGQLSLLEQLTLSDCPSIGGPIPESWMNLATTMQVLDLEGNNLNSTLPDFLADMTEIRELKLANNSFTGTLPLNLLDMKPNLELVTLGFNLFEGDISAAICDVPPIGQVDLRDGFTGDAIDFDGDRDFLSANATCSCCTLHLELDLQPDQDQVRNPPLLPVAQKSSTSGGGLRL